jgi:Protein of unknown function (DUF2853)
MSKFDEALSDYTAEMDKMGVKPNADLLKAVAKSLGPVIYNADACRVSTSDQAEMDRVKQNYLIKKLGLPDGPALDAAIKEVADKFGSSNRNKYRAVFYYLLAQKFGKESIYASN